MDFQLSLQLSLLLSTTINYDHEDSHEITCIHMNAPPPHPPRLLGLQRASRVTGSEKGVQRVFGLRAGLGLPAALASKRLQAAHEAKQHARAHIHTCGHPKYIRLEAHAHPNNHTHTRGHTFPNTQSANTRFLREKKRERERRREGKIGEERKRREKERGRWEEGVGRQMKSDGRGDRITKRTKRREESGWQLHQSIRAARLAFH